MITIIIPTLNRADFVVRTLSYYAATGFSGAILVGDSSIPEQATRLEAYVKRIRDRLNVAYVACPGMSDKETLHRLSTMVETRYATLIGDDDFLVVPGLEACAAFLDANPDFAGANGLAWAFTVEPSSPGTGEVYGRMDVFDAYPQPEFPQPGAAQRFAAHMANYRATLFTLHRAEVWREMWADVLALDDRAFGAELLPSVLSPILGRTKHLDRMYLLRQSHGRRYLLPSASDWMAQPRWQANYERFRELLAERLRARDERPAGDLDAFIRQAFEGGYLSRFRSADTPVPATPPPSLLQRIARRLRPGVRPSAPAPAFTSPLADWLTPGSEHFAAFGPVHRVVSNPQARETGQ